MTPPSASAEQTCPCGHDWTEHAERGCTFPRCGCSRPMTTAATVEVVLRPDQYEFLRSVLWGVGVAYQAADGGPTDGVLRMGDLPGDLRDLMVTVAAARRT